MSISILADKSLLIVFTYAPAGLGHLRVTDALYHGLPQGVTPIILGSNDKTITTLHRIMSIHPFTRSIFEWAQRDSPQEIVTYAYRKFLRSHTKILFDHIIHLLSERVETPKTILFVSTHFGLAHQLAEVKEKLSKEKDIKIILIVQVTDDSPQYIWYVEGADLIFVPSENTKKELLSYGIRAHRAWVKIETVAYPVSPLLGEPLLKNDFQNRLEQLDISKSNPIHIAIPISGAAVGTSFIAQLIYELHKKSERFIFHVISKEAMYTSDFIKRMGGLQYVFLYTSKYDKKVVDLYEEVYKNNIISMEITKPSEQAFKALFSPKQKGGSLLLFSSPVGRQEYDNLNFLRRHFLLPLPTENPFDNARTWRAIELPSNPYVASDSIWWCLSNGIFLEMTKCNITPKSNDPHTRELHSDGVKEFWEKVANSIDKAGFSM